MSSLKRHEGYLFVDHRASPGLPDDMALSMGLPVGGGQGLLEAATYTCSHCNRVVIIEPKRTRERAYCPKCDHLICDRCGAIRAASGGECKTFKQVIEEVQEKGARDAQLEGIDRSGSSIILPTKE